MCRIMANPASRDLIFGFRNRSEKLQQIQTLTSDVENNELKIVEIDNKIKTAENKIKTAENIINDAEKTIKFTQKKIEANNQVIKDTEALISNNEALISNNEKIIKTTEELLSCYKTLLANNESQNNGSKVNGDNQPTKEEKVISTTAYEKAKQDFADLNLDLKNKNQLTKIVEKKSVISTDQSVDDSKTRMTAYNILNDCFNNFRLKYLSSMRWF
jgi:chromosome segregation ATPase